MVIIANRFCCVDVLNKQIYNVPCDKKVFVQYRGKYYCKKHCPIPIEKTKGCPTKNYANAKNVRIVKN